MNGKAAKRIRIAARICTPPGSALMLARTYTRLKREYKALPYHLRPGLKEGHSAVLRRYNP